jgi:hypothetical protein
MAGSDLSAANPKYFTSGHEGVGRHQYTAVCFPAREDSVLVFAESKIVAGLIVCPILNRQYPRIPAKLVHGKFFQNSTQIFLVIRRSK